MPNVEHLCLIRHIPVTEEARNHPGDAEPHQRLLRQRHPRVCSDVRKERAKDGAPAPCSILRSHEMVINLEEPVSVVAGREREIHAAHVAKEPTNAGEEKGSRDLREKPAGKGEGGSLGEWRAVVWR